MKKLDEIIQNITPSKIVGETKGIQINEIQFDSRKVEKGDVFFAITGTVVDGHKFIEISISNGATVIVVEQLPDVLSENVVYIKVQDSAYALALCSASFYDHPSTDLQLVGVTGTNGKTTIATMLYRLFKSLGYKVGLISTIEYLVHEQVISASHTTPDSITLNQLLRRMADNGCSYVFMEVSSHAADQKRTAGLEFAGGIFSNMSHDHLDYHKDFKSYIDAKKIFFDQLGKNAFALMNKDDKRAEYLVQNSGATKYTYALKRMADFKGKILENTLEGLHLLINDQPLFSRLIGDFNAYNLLAVFGCAQLLQQKEITVFEKLSNIPTAEGRFDYVLGNTKNVIGIIDYAHTPDALEKVLVTINELKGHHVEIITVVGCGGDRDKAKRPKMARIACEMSERVFLTSDNPRTESPIQILEDMSEGVKDDDLGKVHIVTNRKKAILTAYKVAPNNAVILIAGKGHEKYQEINGEKIPFDDKEVLREAFQNI